jgi:hypothetical protein
MKANYSPLKLEIMSNKNNQKKDTDRDVRPQRGQETNENWDDNNDQRSSGTTAGKGSDSRRIDEETDTTGVGSNQRSKEDNVGPLESDLEQLPSEKRRDRGNNLTGPGLG